MQTIKSNPLNLCFYTHSCISHVPSETDTDHVYESGRKETFTYGHNVT